MQKSSCYREGTPTKNTYIFFFNQVQPNVKKLLKVIPLRFKLLYVWAARRPGKLLDWLVKILYLQYRTLVQRSK